jgi:hypothetical protein
MRNHKNTLTKRKNQQNFRIKMCFQEREESELLMSQQRPAASSSSSDPTTVFVVIEKDFETV